MRALGIMLTLTALVASVAGYLYVQLFQRGPDPHTWFNDSRRAAAMGLPLLPDYFVNKGLALNTIDNLRRIHPGLGDGAERQRLLENGWLHGQLAYLRLRRGRYIAALEAAQAAFGAKAAAARPNDDDYLRLGIAQFRSGQQEEGWSNLCQALCIGSGIERCNPTYTRETAEIWRLQTGDQGTFEAFVAQLRAAHRQAAPAIELQSDSGTRRRLAEPTGQVLLVNFFSTHCGSCRQELAHLADGLAALAAWPSGMWGTTTGMRSSTCRS